MQKTTVSVLGGGAAGLVAAIFAAKKGCKVTLLERMSEVGKKILMSGGTRCNIMPLHINFEGDYFSCGKQGNRLAKHVLQSWSIEKCYEFFTEEVGLELEVEHETNKYFPKSNSAKEVRDKLLNYCIELGVNVKCNSFVTSMERDKGMWVLKGEGGLNVFSASVIVSTGGLSFPLIGTDGIGHKIVEKMGHEIIKPFPALVPLKGVHPGGSHLQGISLPVSLKCILPATSENTKKVISSVRSGFLFTHHGFSGPSLLDLSHYIVTALENNDNPKPELIVNWGDISIDEWRENLNGNSKELVVTRVKKFLPEKLAISLCSECDLLDVQMSNLSNAKKAQLISLLTSYSLQCTGHDGFKKAEVTGGGVPLFQIDPKTCQSKIVDDLYLCGEIVDVFGRIGGFNFYWAWVSGRLAGISAAKKSGEQ